jgi:hypothetical protein
MSRLMNLAMFANAVGAMTGYATTALSAGSSLAQLHLFTDDGAPRFSFYYFCAGETPAEFDMCWIPQKYFDEWADERHVTIKQFSDGDTYDVERGLSADKLAKSDPGLDYRIVVRFKPVVTPSYQGAHEAYAGLQSYAAPKAGFNADLYVYSEPGGKLVSSTEYHKKTEAQFKGNAVPFVKQGVEIVLTALDPKYAQTHPPGKTK